MPWSPGLALWDSVSVFFLAYTACILPFFLAFLPSGDTWDFSDSTTLFEFVMDIFFLTDIVRNFRTAYYDSHGELVVNPTKISTNYLKTWFTLDLVASFPIEWCINSDSSVDASGSNATGTAGHRHCGDR